MKMTAVKKISAVLIAFIMMFVLGTNAFAETIQDKLEQSLVEASEIYEEADPEEKEEMQDSFSSLLEGAGLADIDLGSLAGGDIGSIISSIGDNLALDSVMGLFTDAFSSGVAMIGDAIGGGLGTSDGSNTATTNPAAGGSPNTIIANTTAPSSTVAVGIPEENLPATATPTTYNPGETTSANIVGAGVSAGTTAANVVIDDTMKTTSIAVIVVLSASTMAIIIAIVIFYVTRRK